jgi:hypothetical protein
MKAEELMIGDWVQGFLPDTYSEVVGIPNEKRVAIMVGGAYMEVSDEDIQPVPLTPEILEKNFGKAVGGKFFDGDDYEELYICEVSDSIWLVRCDNVEFSSIPSEQVMVSHVHQLQHALRHFGIEKEITF